LRREKGIPIRKVKLRYEFKVRPPEILWSNLRKQRTKNVVHQTNLRMKLRSPERGTDLFIRGHTTKPANGDNLTANSLRGA